jgi:hypothetical protein
MLKTRSPGWPGHLPKLSCIKTVARKGTECSNELFIFKLGNRVIIREKLMSEPTEKRPNSQDLAGEAIPPATSGGRAVSASPAGPHPVQTGSASGQSDTRSKEDWIEVHEELPRPTYWPIVMAVAMTLIAFGIVNSVLIIAIGIILLIVALVGWIGDVRDEARLRKH